MMKTARRDRQRGSAMLVTLILIAALLAGIAVLVSMQLTTTKSTELTRSGLAALHCADAGLAASRAQVGLSPAVATSHIAAYPFTTSATTWQVQPTFLTTYFGTTRADLDGDGTNDFTVWIIDNDDGDSNYAVDADSRVWLISRCTKYPDTPKEVRELIQFTSVGTLYDWQEGRAFGNGNANTIN